MRLLAIAAALLLALSPSALAEAGMEALDGYGALKDASGDLGLDLADLARRALSGEWIPDGEALTGLARRLAAALRDGFADALICVMPSVLAMLLVSAVLGGRSGALPLLCRLCCACGMTERFAGMLSVAREAMAAAGKLAGALSPVLASALALSGEAAASAALSPVSALCAWMIEDALMHVGLPLAALAVIVAVAGNLSRSFRLDRLFSLLKRAGTLGVGLLTATFVGAMALEGRLAATQDTLSARALRQAVKGAVPIIGGRLSDAAGALAEGVAALRGAAGLTGMALAAAACGMPVFRLCVFMLSVKLAAAALEPFGDPGITGMLSGFGDGAQLLVALCAGAMLLVALLCGGAMGILGGLTG